MKETTQNKLFNFIITNSNIDDIQSRFISYKLELYSVKKIDSIIQSKDYEYTFNTSEGLFEIKTVNLPIPITTVKKVQP